MYELDFCADACAVMDLERISNSIAGTRPASENFATQVW